MISKTLLLVWVAAAAVHGASAQYAGNYYVRNCMNESYCEYHTFPQGCWPSTTAGFDMLSFCSTPTSCIYNTTYSTPDCTGPAISAHHVIAECNYWEQDYDGGTMGIAYFCNGTGLWAAVCEDFASSTLF